MKKAFTLTEVLITLGIIGVVSALTLPSVIANRRAKVLETQFKKSYSEVYQALLLLKKDDITIYGNYSGSAIKEVLISAFKNAKYGNYGNYYSNYKNYSKGNEFSKERIDDGMIIVNDTFFIFINNNYHDPNSIQLIIDINGEEKPNIMGYDLFYFDLTNGDKLVPVNENYQYFCNQDVTGAGSGLSCASWALRDPNYFKNLKW
jgi:prepilin-type N-terminal cleavage/methylation domain-containing protein